MQNTAEHRKNDGYNVIPIYEDRNSMVSYRGADDIRQRMEHMRERREERFARRIAGYIRAELENCIYSAQDTPEGEENKPMAYERIRVYTGNDMNGKPIYKQVSGKTQDERNDEIVKAYIQSERIWDFIDLSSIARALGLGGIGAAAEASDKRSDITFEEYARTWFDRYKRGQKSATYEYQLESRLNRLIKWFGDKPIAEFTTADIQDFFKNHSTCSRAYLSAYRVALKEIFTVAEEDKILPERSINWRRIVRGGTDTKKRKAASVEEYNHILSQLDLLTDPIEHLAVAILAYTGMRREELLGLRWEDIDLNKRIIHIERAIVYTGKRAEYVIKDPKTKKSKASIPINSALYESLAKYRRAEGWIIHSVDGELFKTQNLWEKYWAGISEHIDLHGLRPSEFRNTVATVMSEMGVNPKNIQRLLRHEKLDTTMNTYAEVDMTRFAESCEVLGQTA